MSLKIDRVQLDIEIKTDKTQQQLNKFDDNISKAKDELKELEKQKKAVEKQKISSGDEGAKAKKAMRLEELGASIEAQKTKIAGLKLEMNKYVDELDLTQLSVSQLIRRYKELNVIYNHTNPHSEQYTKLKDEINAVNLRMKELKGTATETRFSLSKMADGFNKYSMLAASAVASLTGLSMTIRKCVQDYADMKEAEAQVSKYTGQTAEEVDAMNEQMKKMDTRTARAELNELAGEAGKLGFTGSKDIMDFVNAADQINVALGEDIGQDAVKTIGRLAQLFSDGKGNLKEGMLATGSAINQLAQSVGADAPYLVEFESRLGGVAKQAGISQGQLLGFAGVLNRSMQPVEVAATTLNQLISKMMLNPAKFAQLAGKSVKEFTDLLKNDANGAIMTLLQTLQNSGGMMQLAPMLNSMNLDGTRAVSVLSALASKTNDVANQQKIATDAYRQGLSVTQEFNVQNNTVQAGLDKAKKKFLDLSVDLGQKLMPIARYTISSASAGVKILSTLTTFVTKHIFAITTLVSMLTAYKIAQMAANTQSKLHIALEKAGAVATSLKNVAIEMQIIATSKLNGQNGILAASERLLTKAVLAFPGTWMAAAIVGLIAVFVKWNMTMADTQRFARKLNEEIAAEKTKNDEEKKSIEKLLPVAQDAKKTVKERTTAIEELKKIMPDYFGKLDLETAKNYKVAAAVEAANQKYRDKLLLIESQAELEYNNAKSDYNKNHPNGAQAVMPGAVGTQWIDMADKSNLNALEAKMKAAREAVKKSDNEYYSKNAFVITNPNDHNANNKNSVGGTGNGSDTGGSGNGGSGGGTGNGGGSDDKYNKAMQAAEEAYKKQVVELKKQKKDMTITDDQYHQKSYEQEIAYLGRKGDIQKKYGKSTVDTEGEILDKIISETDYQAGEKKKAAEKKLNDELAALDDKHGAEQIATAQQLMNGEIKDKEEYDAKLKNIEQQYWTEKLAIIKANGGDEKETLKQILDQEVADKVAAQQKAAEGVSDKIGATNSISAKNNINEEAYKADIINYQEYQKNKTQIAEEEEQQRRQITEEAFSVTDGLMSAESGLLSALQSRETSQVDAKYKKKIAAAKKAGKDTTKLEEQQEAEKLAIKKKYADKEFALNVLTIIAKTAQGIMSVWAEWGWNPVVAAVFSGLVGVQGILQLATAKAQRDEAAGLYSGGYNDYAEGYTADGDPTDVAGVIPVHKREFVANHVATANPSVRKFLNVFDSGQKDGSIRMWNDADIMQKVGWGPQNGRYTGGYSSGQQTDGGQAMVMVSVADQTAMLDKMTTMAEYMRRVADESITLRDLRKNIKHEEKLEANASR